MLELFNNYGIKNNPYDFYNFIRNNSPVIFNEDNTVTLSLYKDISEVLKSPYSLKNIEDFTSVPNQTVLNLINIRKNYFFGLKTFFDIDGDDHIKIRNLLNDHFSKTSMPKYEKFIKENTNNVLSSLQENDEVDIYAELLHKIPLMMISHILGIPNINDIDLSNNVSKVTKVFEPNIDDNLSNEIGSATFSLTEFLLDVISYKKNNPSDDLLTKIISNTTNTAEIATIIIPLYVAGHITTSYLLATSLKSLLDDVKLKKQYLKDPFNVNYLEEMIRYDSPAHVIQRVTTRDLNLDSGIEIRSGTLIYLLLASANRDESIFDNPDQINLNRYNANKNISFAAGAHFCMGLHLAKSELSIILSRLLKKFPNITSLVYETYEDIAVKKIKKYIVKL